MPSVAARTDARSGASPLSWLTDRIGASTGSPWVMVATREYRLKSVAMDCPALMVVLEGTKRLRIGKAHWVCPAGSYAVIHRAEAVDFENVPDPVSGRYRTWGANFPWHVISLARTLLGPYRPSVAPGAPVAASLGQAEALRRPIEALLEGADGDPAALDHGLLGVLVGLSHLGHGDFLRETAPTLSAQIRLLVASEPGRVWSSAHFEDRLHVSGATLRRRLAEESTSLRELVREARLHHGLILLQTTRQPLKTVAFAAGYRSVPSFSRQFSQRFGVAPSAVGAR